MSDDKKPAVPKPGLPPEGSVSKVDALFQNTMITQPQDAARQTSHPSLGDSPAPMSADDKEEAMGEPQEIPVVALKHGFYDQQRREPGEKFLIRDESELGSWMALMDAGKEKKRRADEAKRKLAARKKAAEQLKKDQDADEE